MKISSYIIIIFFLTNTCFAQNGQDVLQDIKVDVVYLASDYLEGRGTGTKGETLAAEYIVHRFKEIGLEPKGVEGTWFQSFTFKYKPNPHAKEEGEIRTGKNVVAYLDNQAEQTVVIGGHYDHLGWGDFGSLHGDERAAIHNGADDNASGIAALFYIAESLKNSDFKNNNYLFIAFSGEEMGLYGSKHYTAAPTIELSSMNYMINMDMVGRLNEEKTLVVNGVGTSPSWKKLQDIKVGNIQIKTTESGIGASDHTSFYLKEVPALHFFTGQHKHYHKPEDDAKLVNFEGIIDVADYILALIATLDSHSKLEFTKTKDSNERQAAAFKVTLGVMPDYVYDGKGMRIDSVLGDRPAEKGGLEDGDIVIKLGDVEVTDIYSYMEALSKFEKGQKTIVVVKRGEKEVSKKVTF